MSRPPFHYSKVIPLVPAITEDNAHYFMSGGTFLRESICVEGMNIHTAPLSPDYDVDLIEISEVPRLLEREIQDRQDQLVPSLSIRDLYIKFLDREAPVRFADMHHFDAYFDRQFPEGNSRVRGLKMPVKYTSQWCGYDLDWTLLITGEVHLEMGTIRIWMDARLNHASPLSDAPFVGSHELDDIRRQALPKLMGYSVTAYRGKRK